MTGQDLEASLKQAPLPAPEPEGPGAGWAALPALALRVGPRGELLARSHRAAAQLPDGPTWADLGARPEQGPCPVGLARAGAPSSGQLRIGPRVFTVDANPDGEGGAWVVLREVTDELQVEAARRRVMAFSDQASSMAHVGWWVVDLTGGPLMWSDEVKRIHEVPRDYRPSLDHALSFYPPGAREQVQAHIEAAIRESRSWTFELPLITARGRRKWVRCHGRPELDGVGEGPAHTARLVGTFQDVTDRRTAEDQLRDALSRAADWEALFQMASGLALIADTRFRFLQVNGAWTRKLGWTRAELLSRSYIELVHPDDVARTIAEGERLAAAPGETLDFTNRYRTASGQYVWLAWNAVSDPARERVFAFATDVTPLKEGERALDERARRAERATEAKSAFLATMSHEIRTPMNGVIGLAELLLGTPLSAEQRGYAEKIQLAGGALLGVINDVLDLSKVEAGRLEVESLPFDLREVLAEVVQLQLPTALAKGVSLQVDVQPDLPPALLGDPGRLRQILMNLVSNAIKFTPEGAVRLEARSAPGPAGAAAVELRVIDTGIGVAEEAQQALFQPFSQGGASTARRFGGTGLGLAICRHLARLMGGEIGLQSAEGQGSTFWLRLTLPVAELQLIAEPPLALGERPGAGMRVLLVEDNAVNQLVAGQMLRNLGCDVDVVPDGVEALATLRDIAYDLVFMDCLMPRMDGIEATRRLRAGEAGPRQPPVVALTAHAMSGDRQACIEAGMNGFLTKPLTAHDLAQALARWSPARPAP